MQGSNRDDSESYRPWPQDQSYSSIDSSHPAPPGSTSLDPSLRGPPAPGSNEHGPNWSNNNNNNHSDTYGPSRYSQSHEQYNQSAQPQHSPTTASHPPPPNPPPVDTSMYASAQYAQQQHQQQAQSHYHHQAGYPVPPPDDTPNSTIPPLPRHTYTRTLVGPLSANACRLLDEHRKPGIFFLFQDLSIRTEGKPVACHLISHLGRTCHPCL